MEEDSASYLQELGRQLHWEGLTTFFRNIFR